MGFGGKYGFCKAIRVLEGNAGFGGPNGFWRAIGFSRAIQVLEGNTGCGGQYRVFRSWMLDTSFEV